MKPTTTTQVNKIDIQWAYNHKTDIQDNDLIIWSEAVAKHFERPLEGTIRIVDEEEIIDLNTQFRNKKSATNVLAFCHESIPDLPDMATLDSYLGDIALCLPYAQKEATQQNKELKHHLAHLIIHAWLHLLGYDHQNDEEQNEMEAIEVDILDKQLHIANPYKKIPDQNT